MKKIQLLCAVLLVFLAFSPAVLGDTETVHYADAASNTTSGTESFSMTYTLSFATTTFTASDLRASLGVSLTDGTDLGTGVALYDISQTATLSYVLDNVVQYSVPLTNADLTLAPFSATDGDSSTATTRTTQFPAYTAGGPTGTFNLLTVTVSGNYSAGADLGVSGRVDVEPAAVPEPASLALSLICAIGFVACARGKRLLSLSQVRRQA